MRSAGIGRETSEKRSLTRDIAPQLSHEISLQRIPENMSATSPCLAILGPQGCGDRAVGGVRVEEEEEDDDMMFSSETFSFDSISSVSRISLLPLGEDKTWCLED